MDSVSFPSPGYALIGVQPTETAAPPETAAPAPPFSAAAAAPAPPLGAGTFGPVPDFLSSLSGSFVLEWRDPDTHQVIDQVPMRTALAQFAEIDGTSAVSPPGKIVNTAA